MKSSLLIYLFCFNAFSMPITEKNLIELANSNSPHTFEQLANLMQADFNQREYENDFGFVVTAQGKHERTKEKPLISFSPVFSPVTQAGLAVSKNIFYGVNLNAGVGFDKREFLFSGSPTYRKTVSGNVGLNVDLWRDLLGRTSRSRKNQLNITKQIKELEKKTADKQFQINIRKLYWNLVANKEKENLANQLYQQSLKQTVEIEKRFKSSIADRGDVALYKSQVASRKGQIIGLQYEKTQIEKNLKSLLPELVRKNLELNHYDIEQTMLYVLACTEKIKKHEDIPYQNTYLDEVIELIKQSHQLQNDVTNIYGDPDLKLQLGAKTTGVGDEYISASEDYKNHDRAGYSVGITLTVPFGYKDFKTKNVKKAYEKNRNKAQIENAETYLSTTHHSVVSSIGHLFAVIEAQKENNQNLLTRINVTKKKFKQGRIPLSELIRDQDNYLSGELNVIDTKLIVLTTILDYLSVFTTTSCQLNRI